MEYLWDMLNSIQSRLYLYLYFDIDIFCCIILLLITLQCVNKTIYENVFADTMQAFVSKYAGAFFCFYWRWSLQMFPWPSFRRKSGVARMHFQTCPFISQIIALVVIVPFKRYTVPGSIYFPFHSHIWTLWVNLFSRRGNLTN